MKPTIKPQDPVKIPVLLVPIEELGDTACTADYTTMKSLGITRLGLQVRVGTAHDFALFTLTGWNKSSDTPCIGLSREGFSRCGGSKPRPVIDPTHPNGWVSAMAVHPSYSDAEAESNGEFVERLKDTNSGKAHQVIALAPHGGKIEDGTDDQAEQLRTLLTAKGIAATAWVCKGYRPGGGAYLRWHITSTEISPRSFPLLGTLVSSPAPCAVAFHGFGNPGVLIGGGASPELKQALADALRRVLPTTQPVEIATSGRHYDGDDPHNLVNRVADQGLQIEQSLQVRHDHANSVVEAVATVLESWLASHH